MEYSQQTQAALQNLKTLLLLDIQLLLGCNVEWSVTVTPPPDGAVADPPVLSSVSTAGDGADDDSPEEGGSSGGAASPRKARIRCGGGEATATSPRAPGTPLRGGGGRGAAAPDTGAAAAAVGGGAAPPAAAAPGVLDLHDFTTWGPDTWGLLPLDELKFATDPNMSICPVGSYLAIAMVLWYQDDLRLKHMRLWGELNYAWSATFQCFHCDLYPNGLEKWQESGPHAFTESESRWLDGTLRFLKKTAARSAGRPARNKAAPAAAQAAAPPPPQGKAAPAPRGSRKDEAAQ